MQDKTVTTPAMLYMAVCLAARIGLLSDHSYPHSKLTGHCRKGQYEKMLTLHWRSQPSRICWPSLTRLQGSNRTPHRFQTLPFTPTPTSCGKGMLTAASYLEQAVDSSRAGLFCLCSGKVCYFPAGQQCGSEDRGTPQGRARAV